MDARRLSFAVRARWLILGLTLVGVAMAGVLGADVASHLVSGGFEDTESESARATAILEERFDVGAPNVILVVDALGQPVDSPAVAAAGTALAQELGGEPNVVEVASYWTLGNAPPLRSTDGTKALVLARLDGTEEEILARGGEILAGYEGEREGLRVLVGGFAATFAEVNEVIEADLLKAEAIAFPLTLILLILVFGSVVAALLPLAVGGFAILGTFLVLRTVAEFTDVSIFALNFTTAMGLGLAIDYALLVVSRFREELAAGHATAAAVDRTLRTAGRTVLFSAATVASALAALLVFRFAFLRSFAYAGIAVVGLAAIGATVVLPALLAILGPRVNLLTIRRGRPDIAQTGRWHRVAMAVMRRPIPIATVVVVFLAVLALPFADVQLGFPDDRVLPPTASSRQVGDLVREEFASAEAGAINVVTVELGDGEESLASVDGYAAELSRLDGVARVDAATGVYVRGMAVAGPSALTERLLSDGATALSVVPSIEPMSPQGEQLVAEIRSLPAPFPVVVGGGPSELVDGKAGLLAQLPVALALIAVITFIVLFLQFGSVVMPLKAIVLNLFSLTATFGAMVWIFQEGHLAGVLGFTPTGTLVMTMPVLMFCIAFGLSMDYEVFLLSRIKEEYDRTGDNVASVASGLERTGRIVTAAAILIGVVFAAFSTGQVSFMKMFGIGMTLAVVVDAFLIRATLVPAFMRLAGEANWWAPAPLRRFHDRFGLREHLPELNQAEPVVTGAS